MNIAWRPRRFEIAVVSAILMGLCVVLFMQLRNVRRGETCQTNLKNVGLAMMIYVRDYDEHFPVANRWIEVLRPYTRLPFARDEFIFYCPSAPPYGYSMNSNFDKLQLSGLQNPSRAPMIFESSALRDSQNDTGESWLMESRHPQGVGVIFGDTHTEWRQQPPQFSSLHFGH